MKSRIATIALLVSLAFSAAVLVSCRHFERATDQADPLGKEPRA